jgi:hypothetical protein
MIKTRDILILLGIAVFAVLVALFIHSTPNSKLSNVQSSLLVEESSIQFDDIRKIELLRKGEHFVFEKMDGVWVQQFPFQMLMDSSSIRAIIETVQGVQKLGTLGEKASHEVLGLGNGANAITLFDGNAKVKVSLGRKTLGGRAYAQLNDEEVVTIDHSLHRIAVEMEHRLWRDIRLFPNFAIDGMEIHRVIADDSMHLDRHDGHWKMNKPVNTRVNQELFAEWIGRLAAARVGSYVVDEPEYYKDFGLDSPSATFTTINRNGKTRTLLVGSRVSAGSQDRYAMLDGQPAVFRMTWDALSELFPRAEMFVDETGSSTSMFDVKQVVIRTEGLERTFTRDLERWVDENGIQTDNKSIRVLLNWILEDKPTSVAIAKYPRDDEQATVTLVGYDLVPLDTVRIALDASGQWILENGDNVLRIHPSESGAALTPFQH